jgi:mono/diheme cytochrome c family protein
MHTRKLIWVVAAMAALAIPTAAQAQQQNAPTIKHVPIRATSPVSGKEMFKSYCAVCHGLDGTGNGPAAEALKTPPANLTRLSLQNGGKFPAIKVANTIRGDVAVSAHGNREMPVWGHLFMTVSGGHETEVQQRVANLTQYVESLQAK